ncbi:hypothetical protein CROQUDRAFT_650973 [Cronartium quercuum f. sp. fusiforme G11]|uniref:Uncharacterized protein n=1 Tax=Cronartium quercuum f. sp. fusiforme G11 TaxID=708437 RepID=A0A9P6NWP4_9BASI|nr:hypothetical protein CROQUDRAFT_650973 [Cronartium quercuum f. sp. fusiforme G11]
MFNGLKPFIRSFTTESIKKSPLQPLKQRKTIPFRQPRRPHLIDPIYVDPNSKIYSLKENREILFIIREPQSLKSLENGQLSNQPIIHDLSKPINNHTLNKINESDDKSKSCLNIGLSNPTLTFKDDEINHQHDYLPPPIRKKDENYHQTLINLEDLKKIRLLRSKNLSLTKISQKFKINRIFIQMLGIEDNLKRKQINLKHLNLNLRKESKFSYNKLARRVEKRFRRSLW